MRLILVRHGLTEWNADRRLQGHADIELSETGRQQARALKPIVAGIDCAKAVSSDLARARQTAELMGVDDPLLDPGLRERDVGVWTGQRIDDLKATEGDAWQGWHSGQSTPPDAETWATFTDRVVEALRRHCQGAEGTVLVVCHGGVIRASVCHFLGLRLDQVTPVAQASMTVLRGVAGAETPTLELFNFRPGGLDFDTPE